MHKQLIPLFLMFSAVQICAVDSSKLFAPFDKKRTSVLYKWKEYTPAQYQEAMEKLVDPSLYNFNEPMRHFDKNYLVDQSNHLAEDINNTKEQQLKAKNDFLDSMKSQGASAVFLGASSILVPNSAVKSFLRLLTGFAVYQACHNGYNAYQTNKKLKTTSEIATKYLNIQFNIDGITVTF